MNGALMPVEGTALRKGSIADAAFEVASVHVLPVVHY